MMMVMMVVVVVVVVTTTLLNNGGDINKLHNVYALIHSTSTRISINYCTSIHWGRAVA